jgi:hypothetical protein
LAKVRRARRHAEIRAGSAARSDTTNRLVKFT